MQLSFTTFLITHIRCRTTIQQAAWLPSMIISPIVFRRSRQKSTLFKTMGLTKQRERTLLLHSGSFDEFYYRLKFAHEEKKNSSNRNSVILKKSIFLSFDEFFRPCLQMWNKSGIRENYHCVLVRNWHSTRPPLVAF